MAKRPIVVCALFRAVVFAELKLLCKVSPRAALKSAELPAEAVGLINVKLLLASLVKVADPLESAWEIFPSKSMEEEEPSIIATGTLAVVVDQEVNASIDVGVLGEELVEVLLELLPPPQAANSIVPKPRIR